MKIFFTYKQGNFAPICNMYFLSVSLNMPLSKKQIAQRKNFKNRSNNSSTGQFEESKVSDSSDSDFILSDEIYSSDSSINISDTDTEMTLEQDKKDLVNFNLISIDDKKRRKKSFK